MKIAIDISQIVYEGTGVANYTKQLVTSLVKHDRENAYLLFGYSLKKRNKLENYYAKLKGTAAAEISCRFFSVPQTLVNGLWNSLHIITAERWLGKIDVLHSSDWIQPPARCKKVTTVHDLTVLKYPQYSHQSIVSTQKKRLYWVKKECDAVIADSYATKKDTAEYLDIPVKKIEVVYPGIDPVFQPQWEAKKEYIRKKYGLSESYILAVGTREPRKNLKAVLAAYRKFVRNSLVVNRRKKTELVIAGKEGWGEKIQEEENIRILGYLEKRDLPSLYSAAEVFIYPSFYEGFGLPVVEAMACGVPVITSDRGSLKEVASDSAVIVDPEDYNEIVKNLVKIVIDDDFRNQIIRAGYENAKKFTWDRAAEQVIGIYGKLYRNG